MAYFVWGDYLNIDHGPIDDDHRKPVDCVNRLHSATSEGRGQEVVAGILDNLITYTRQHFDREEREMERYRFPHLDAHKQQHQLLMKEVQALKAKFDAGGITVASQVSTLLRDWLSLHIRRHDKELGKYIQRAARQVK